MTVWPHGPETLADHAHARSRSPMVDVDHHLDSRRTCTIGTRHKEQQTISPAIRFTGSPPANTKNMHRTTIRAKCTCLRKIMRTPAGAGRVHCLRRVSSLRKQS